MNSLKKLMRYLLIAPFLCTANGLFMLAFGGLDNHSPADAPKSYKEFKSHLVKAKSGDSYAQYVVFLAYYDGSVVARDFVAADAWGTLAAKQGLAKAQFWLGYMHYHYDVEPAPIGERDPDYKKAFYWFQLGAKQGQSGSQYHLGRMYENGWGTTIDHHQAIYWYELAAKQDHLNAIDSFNKIHKRYELFEEYLTQAKTDDAQAQWQICQACIDGRINTESELIGSASIDKNLIKEYCNHPITWGISAARQGLYQAQYRLGYYYLHGKGVAKNIEQALYWLKLSAESPDNYGRTENYLGDIYQNGNGVEKNINEAIYWYERAAQKGRGDAKDQLKKLRGQQ